MTPAKCGPRDGVHSVATGDNSTFTVVYLQLPYVKLDIQVKWPRDLAFVSLSTTLLSVAGNTKRYTIMNGEVYVTKHV